VTLQPHVEPGGSQNTGDKPKLDVGGDCSAPELPTPAAAQLMVSRMVVAEDQQGTATGVHALHPSQDVGAVEQISQQLFKITW
jgi:hypothetical protein